MKNKTIIFVMPRLPFPASSGRKASLYHYCRILSKELNCRLIVAAFLERGDFPNNKPDFIDELVILPKPSVFERIKNIVFNSFVLKKFPMQVALYLNPKVKGIIEELVKKYKPDFVIADMVRCTEYIKNIDSYKIADLDDRISLRYKRQLNNDIDSVNPYGALLNSIPKTFHRLLLNNRVKKIVLENEIDLLNKYELQIGKICDLTVFVAKQESQNFNIELGENKSIDIPIGVDVDYFVPATDVNEGNYIGFLGALSVAHNENAVKYFIKSIFPKIIKKNPNAKFLVIGGGASEELKSLQDNNIIFTGMVDDVRVYLSKCKVFVCPMKFGSGIKTKNLEAMAMGLPLVTTAIGAENLNGTDGMNMFIEDNEDSFALTVSNLLDDRELRDKIGKNARKFVIDEWTWETAKKQFQKIVYKEI